jgi:glucose/arabinose dehydrogenase
MADIRTIIDRTCRVARRALSGRTCAATLAAVGVLSAGVDARSDFSYTDFSSTAGVSLVASAAGAGNVLRVSPAVTAQRGAAWVNTRQQFVHGFDTTFTIRFSQRSGAGGGGLALVIQNDSPTAIGSNVGCGIGYQGITTFLASSLAIEFDTRQEADCRAGDIDDPDGAHVSIHMREQTSLTANEASSIGLGAGIAALSGDAPVVCRVRYVPGTLSVYVNDLVTPVATASVDLSLLGNTSGAAFFGFTSANGEDGAQASDLLSWTFVSTPAPPDVPPYRPDTPRWLEPSIDGRLVNGFDVHMEIAPMTDRDGHGHLASDFEIWSAPPTERVWFAHDVRSASKVHIHLGDGVFENSHAGRSDLIPERTYMLRARVRDDSGDSTTQWSYWSNRQIKTVFDVVQLPFVTDDLRRSPAPAWRTNSGAPVAFPPVAAGQQPATLTLDQVEHGTLLRLIGEVTGVHGPEIVNPKALPHHEPVRLRINPGDATLIFPETTFTVTTHECDDVTIYLPEFVLEPGDSLTLWIWENGTTFYGNPNQMHPDFFSIARNSDIPWSVRQPGFHVGVFARELQLPVDIEVVPNPAPNPNDVFMYVAELYGRIQMITRDGTVSQYASGLLNFNPFGSFPGSGELGIGGIAIDPANGDLLVSMLYEIPGQGLFPRIERLNSTDGGRTMTSRTLIKAFPNEPMGASHQISHLHVEPDGSIFFHCGDGFDITKPLDLNSIRGKTLRMLANGDPHPSNPFYNAGNGLTATDYVYTYGHRNPFGGGRRLTSGKNYVVENGPAVDRFAVLNVGFNFGYDGTEATMRIGALFNWEPAHAPVGLAFPEPGRFGGSGFPASSFGNAFVAESGPTFASGRQGLGKRIIELPLTPDDRMAGPDRGFVEYNGIGRATVVALAMGPDGMYFSDFYKDTNLTSPIDRGSRIMRVTYAAPQPCPDECPADVNADGTVDFFDYLDFVQNFAGENPGADYNADGTLDFFDYLDFVADFSITC